MSDKITTVQILDFIAKSQTVSSKVDIEERDGGYNISIYCDWDDNDDFYVQSTFISNKGKSVSQGGDTFEFYTMLSMIDHEIEKATARETKRQKRQELLSRLVGLTDEEKELIGFWQA